jgi:hypothetical protein
LRRIGTQARTKSSRFGYAFADFFASHMRSPSSAGAGSVALIILPVSFFSSFTSRAMVPGFFGEVCRRRCVQGRPSSGFVPTSKPVRKLGDHADVTFPPPFAIGEDVEARVFLQRDDVAHRGFHARVVIFVGDVGVVGDEIFDELRRGIEPTTLVGKRTP